MGGENQQLQMDSLYPWLLRHSCLSSRLAGKMNTFIPALEVHQDPVQLLNTSFTKPYKASASKNWAWKYIPQQQDCFPPSRLKSLIWRTKEVACTALSTAKPRDSHLQFPYSSTDVQLLSLSPIHILEEHHLITYISSKHPFFSLSLESVASTQKQESLCKDLKWVLRVTSSVGPEDIPVSGGFKGSLLWWTGNISSLTFSEVAAKSWVASNKEQCSVLVPSMERMWSPTCNAPHLQRKQQER